MALVAVGPSRKTQMAVVAPPSVPERLAQAQAAEVRPRSRVAELQAAFDAALAGKKYGDADRLQGELHEARLVLVEAEGVTRGIREGIAAAEQVQAVERKAIDDAQREVECRRVIEDAIAAEKRAMDGIEESLAEMRACLGAARQAFATAQSWQAKTGQERQRILQARVALGEAGLGGRLPEGANRATVIGERDPLVRELLRWDGRAWRL